MAEIEVPYLPIGDFDASEFSKKFSEEPKGQTEELNDGFDFSDEVVFILHGMGMEKYVELFKKEQIELDTFLQLNEADLKEIGISDPKDRKVIAENLGFYLPSRNEVVVSENHCEDLKILKNVSHELILLENYCAYLELQMKKHNLTDYRVSADEFACTYLKAFAKCALKQSQILCSRIYDEQNSDALIDKVLKAYKLVLSKDLQESLPKKQKNINWKVSDEEFMSFSFHENICLKVINSWPEIQLCECEKYFEDVWCTAPNTHWS